MTSAELTTTDARLPAPACRRETPSLLGVGAGARVAAAGVLSALLWLAVAWASHGGA